MGDLSKNLSRSEMSCPCGCGHDTVDHILVEAHQACCDHFAVVYHTRIRSDITGPNRCAEYNATVEGAADNSQHIYGRAMDHKLYIRDTGTQITPKESADYYEEHWPKLSVGRYLGRTHLDSRTDGSKRWDKT